ncbi:MAG: FadR family transcriptional regulator, partial [Betaproteobacteria bacterium]|nr:FadR family transcriptional regulator [Betaproteobacteria bacterium]
MPVENRRLYRQIADQIASLIDRGNYRLGTRLPPERDLAGQLGVSRPSVREALIALEVEGYVEVRMGSGVYVIDPRQRALSPKRMLDQETGPFELIVTRRLVESECAALAARAATPEQVAAIRASLEAMTVAATLGKQDTAKPHQTTHAPSEHQAPLTHDQE